VARLLAKDRTLRPRDAREVLRALERIDEPKLASVPRCRLRAT